MNVYFIGMIISMILYLAIGYVVSRHVKDANDYYVAGRRAPLILIAGSLIASYTATGLFMGDAAEAYSGGFSYIAFCAVWQTAGFYLGSVFFGRYLRRSGVSTIPEFFGRRFCSNRLRVIATATAVVTMIVYLFSVMTAIGKLMNAVTGVPKNICMLLAMIVFTLLTIMSGSRGVLITDTLMAALFTVAVIVSTFVIASKNGGWYESIALLTKSPETAEYISWTGKEGIFYPTHWEYYLSSLITGCVWIGVCMVGPWQTSRYLMAKDEHTVIKAGPISTVAVALLELLVALTAVIVNTLNPDISDPALVLVWASMNVLPTVLGVILLTGVLAAGISSATTFLSLIGTSVAYDIAHAEGKKAIKIGRISMAAVSVIILVITFSDTVQSSIFWLMLMGGAMITASWLPAALAAIFSKKASRFGVSLGMAAGFLVFFIMRLYVNINGVSLPAYADPALVGFLANVLLLVIGSLIVPVSEEEKTAREALFVIPESEKDPKKIRSTLRFAKISLFMGAAVALIMMVLWAIPHMIAS